jgi:hypothetical protein
LDRNNEPIAAGIANHPKRMRLPPERYTAPINASMGFGHEEENSPVHIQRILLASKKRY